MPRLLQETTNTKNVDQGYLPEDDIHVGDILYGPDGTEYNVLTVHRSQKRGIGTSLSLLNLTTSRGIQKSLKDWQVEGISISNDSTE